MNNCVTMITEVLIWHGPQWLALFHIYLHTVFKNKVPNENWHPCLLGNLCFEPFRIRTLTWSVYVFEINWWQNNTLSLSTVRYSGVLSAYGLALADVVEEVQEPCSLQYVASSYSELDRRIEDLSQRCDQILRKQGFSRSLLRIQSHWKACLFAHLVYH